MTSDTVSFSVNGRTVTVPKEYTILQALETIGIKIPRLCCIDAEKPEGSCRVCLVEVNNRLVSACTFKVNEGLVVLTNTPAALDARRDVVEFLLARHFDMRSNECPSCSLKGDCGLNKLSQQVGARPMDFCLDEERILLPQVIMPGFIRDPNFCILCDNCVRMCNDIQEVGALVHLGRAFDGCIEFYPEKCVQCGQCIHVCPTAALADNPRWVDEAWKAINDPTKHVVFQIAPAARVAGELWGLPVGTNVIGKIYHAVRLLGANAVFDTNLAADTTIMEEARELIERMLHGGVLPMFTSCCPPWVMFLEKKYPDLLGHLSSCKSPQQMMGALIKTYYAKKKGLNPANIVVVSVMPCTAKHFEAERPEMHSSGFRDVDIVLTTREFYRMLIQAGIQLPDLPEESADPLLGEYSGAATIFGASGGVMEAAVRSAHFLLTGKDLGDGDIDIHAVRGMESVKEATIPIVVDGKTILLRVAVVHGLGNVEPLLKQIRQGTSPYHFIEVMTCPGGCVGGGGQPRGYTLPRREERAGGLYGEDAALPLPRRFSHHNEEVKALYRDYLGDPGSHRAHELLHTTYGAQS